MGTKHYLVEPRDQMMGKQFDWQFNEEDEQDVVHAGYNSLSSGERRSWILAGIILTMVLGGWIFIQLRQKRITDENISIVQRHIDLEDRAYDNGDGELFYSLQANDPAWFSAQLRPENQAFYSGTTTLQITQADAYENSIGADVQWQDDAGVWQRLIFLERLGTDWVRVPSVDAYWANQLIDEQEWGKIRYHAVDEKLIPSIVLFVDKIMAEVCTEGCDAEQMQFMLDVRADFTETADPDQINIPSPRLIGLDEAGRPSPTFWQQLRRRIEDRLTPAMIRFVIPPPRSGPCCRNLDFEGAADEFMRQNPNIKVELVALDTLPDDLSSLATEFDGAAVPPTVDMVAAGKIYDLTDFAVSDPDFVASDFYEHIWQGTQWRGRMWFMPLTAEFNLLYYDKEAYAIAGVPEPNLFWQWTDISESGSAVLAAQPEYSSLTWQFLDISRDALFAYAYSLADSCPDGAIPPCLQPLQPHHIAGALEWHKDLVQQDQIPDLTQESADGRESIMVNFQSAKRHALIWVAEPNKFEYYQLLYTIGIVPFPGVESMEGVTPLWVDGAFISSQSTRPYATWQWLKFLSYQPPVSSYRLVPARPSVATETNYWRSLPRPLVNAMRTAYTFSRPVTLPEKRYFDWTQLAEVVSEAYTPEQSAQQPPSINWFGQK
jgi:ABC-type glycerol-3-phosphate transport system substrate-binding protein